jgi:hypothetical protein
MSVSGRGERYDYLPIIELPGDAGVPETGVPEGTRVNARSGTVSGPEPFTDMQSPFTIELSPYAVTLLLFDAPN